MKQKAPLSLAVDYALLVTLASFFGIAFMWTKLAVAEVPPATIVFSRLVIGAGFVYVAMRFAGERLTPLLAHWRMIFVVGFFGSALPFFLISWGQEKVDAGLTSILMAVMPLITIVLAHFFTGDEKLNAYKVVGFIFGLIGVAVLLGIDKLTQLGSETIRQLAIIGGSLCYAIHAIISKQVVKLPRFALSTAVLIAPAILISPVVILFDQPWDLAPSATALWSILALGAVPTGLGMIMLFAIIERQGAGFISQINFLVPLFGVLFAVLLLNETLPANAAFALVIILAGVGIARIQPKSNQMEKSK